MSGIDVLNIFFREIRITRTYKMIKKYIDDDWAHFFLNLSNQQSSSLIRIPKSIDEKEEILSTI